MPHRRSYSSDAIVVHWNSARCIHTGNCLRALPQVFDTARRPWVDIDAADADRIAEAVERCPTGALLYERLDGRPGERPPRPTVVVATDDGPLFVTGDLAVEGPEGEEIAHEARLALCRCGRTRNQPFCDNAHVRRGWRSSAPAAPADEPPAPLEGAAEAPTRVVPLADGPLELHGYIRIVAPGGALLAEAGRVRLCRCGHSGNKPFCDGSHEEAGFRSRAPRTARDRAEAETPAAFSPNPRAFASSAGERPAR